MDDDADGGFFEYTNKVHRLVGRHIYVCRYRYISRELLMIELERIRITERNLCCRV